MSSNISPTSTPLNKGVRAYKAVDGLAEPFEAWKAEMLEQRQRNGVSEWDEWYEETYRDLFEEYDRERVEFAIWRGL